MSPSSTKVFESARKAWWFVSDSSWRQAYLVQQRRIADRRRRQALALKEFPASAHSAVFSGPFKGMRYPSQVAQHVLTQKLLGMYELELHEIILEIVSREYDLVVDIGAAEGYYVTGMAMSMPSSAVVAFEAQTPYHDVIRALAKSNGVLERITVHGTCSPGDLETHLAGCSSPFILCDIEGAERDILNPDQTTALRTADILVEVHEEQAPGVTRLLQERFSSSHDVEMIATRPRVLSDLPAGIRLSEDLALAAMDECRGGSVGWLWMRRRQSR